MIEPALADDAFLGDVRSRPRGRDAFDLWWVGQSGFLIHWDGNFILIDPYLSDSLTAKYAATEKPHVRMSRRVIDPKRLDFVTVITSSHSHTDHLDAETLRPIVEGSRGVSVVAPAANVALAAARLGVVPEYIYGANDGQSVATCRTRIHAVAAAHDKLERDAEGRCKCLGYVFEFGGFGVYHSGDSVVYAGMADALSRFKIDVAILPINGKVGNMGGRDAARLAKDIGARLVIPCHYDMFAFNTADPNDEFVPECERLGQPYRVLRLGERFSSAELPPRAS